MKKTIKLIFVFVLLVNKTFGQLGLVCHDSLLWQQSTYYADGPVGPGMGMLYYYTYNNYYINGDTVIGDKTFKKLFASTSTSLKAGYNPPAFYYSSLGFKAFIFEDSNCVYLVDSIGNMTKVLDYNLQVGDSFKFNGYSPKLVLLSIDSTLISGKYLTRFNFEKDIIWIKGIGDVSFGASFASYYFLNPSGYSWRIQGSYLTCYSERNVSTIGNKCNLPQIVDIGFDNEATDVRFSIFPIPATSLINIISLTNDKTAIITINDIHGRCIDTYRVTNGEHKIDVSELVPGIYVLNLKSDQGVCTKKIVVNHL